MLVDANLSASTLLSSEAQSSTAHMPDELKPPVEDWCFDILLYYRAAEDETSIGMLDSLERYSIFSFAVNGVATCMLVGFGLLGNLLFLTQLHNARYFSRRLAAHLSMLCAWDMTLLMCCLLAYGIISTIYGMVPFVGVAAYLLYFLQPFASFCVTGTIWQVLVMTAERYAAVSSPLQQRTRNAQFPLPLVFTFIALGAFLLNIVVVPLERRITKCYEFTEDGFAIRAMIVQRELANNEYYAMLVHLLPDIVFRAPIPIILIAFLTVRTLQICNRSGQIGQSQTQQSSGRNNVPFMLTLLNVKFITCNTLYLFNTILMEIMGYGGRSTNRQSELEMEQYVHSLYLTDFSNLLLAVHSATNWLVFFRWPTPRDRRWKGVVQRSYRPANHSRHQPLVKCNSAIRPPPYQTPVKAMKSLGDSRSESRLTSGEHTTRMLHIIDHSSYILTNGYRNPSSPLAIEL